ncbi:unnamed protein product [Zymoseptoria tritici ST99CH_1A5]|uniref:DUF3669 domain-containing protein n=1 Tax=Zymoseptoria tritici ST99CH_1A5 TaxID=1276529 RepID=A0A1Y6LJQ9_ZYMTR|nr:unnamed protein product [Zymoseptoria tritici ST99CH_1A5]
MAPPMMRQIGKGFCGSVWVDPDIPSLAMKREDGGPYRSVTTDSDNHTHLLPNLYIARNYLGLATQVLIPQHHGCIHESNTDWWYWRAESFPAGYEHTNTLITERIPPLPLEAREKLIDLFCAENTKEAVRKSRQDEDCLVRPYLGRRTYRATPSKFFTLRNKPLCINQMESINLPVQDYARTMAEGLAVMYWKARTDANDIEFVLAPGRSGGGDFDSEVLGRHSLWVLDFDCVKMMTLDVQGIEQAAAAYMRNDPYWPRPGSEVQADQDIWEIFRVRFLEASARILGNGSELGQLFVKRLELLVQQSKENKLAIDERLGQEDAVTAGETSI